MLTACKSYPKKEQETVKYLDPGYFPELINIENFSVNEKRLVLDFMTEVYSEHLKLLISAKSTGMFIDDIDYEIEDCRAAIDWISSISL